MKAKARLLVFALIGLLLMANSGYAATIDSLQRSLSIMGVTDVQSNNMGAFFDGLSWPGAPVPYNPELGRNYQGASVYQKTTVVNELDIIAVSGHGGLNVWWSQGYQTFSALSHLYLEFTPLTAASYDYSTGNDGGYTLFKDTVTDEYIYDGTGFLIAGHKYLVEGDVSITNLSLGTYGAFWSMDLKVQEQPASVPIPGGFLLLAPALAGLGLLRKRFTN